MKRITILLQLIALLVSAQARAQAHDPSLDAVIPFSGLFVPIPGDVVPAKLDSNEISKLHKLYTACVEEYNRKMDTLYQKAITAHPREKIFRESIDLTQPYYKQFMPVTDKQGDKIVWVNCLCHMPLSSGKTWTRSPAIYADGSSCYFHFIANLTKNEYYGMTINSADKKD